MRIEDMPIHMFKIVSSDDEGENSGHLLALSRLRRQWNISETSSALWRRRSMIFNSDELADTPRLRR
jgi:hypothetical protein